MTTSEYQAYQTAVAQFMDHNQVRPGCYGPAFSDNEPFFTWQPCECCNRHFGGNRVTYGFSGELGIFTADICTDCVYYLAYGQLDDMTMMMMEDKSS